MMDYGTSDENLGRLEKNAENAKNDREKVDALIALAYKLRGAGSQRAGKLIEEAYLLAKSINYEKGIGYSLDAKGLQHIFSAEFETALNTYNEARDIFIKIGNSVGEARVLGHFGVIYRSVGDLERAVQAYLDSLELIEKSADKNEPAAKQTNGWSLFGLAGIHFDLKEFEPALEYYRKSLKLFEKIDFKSGAASAMNGIGITYQAMNQNKRAVGYHFKSLELNRICDFYIGISRSLSDIGTCYENSGDYATALEYNFKSLAIREKAGSRSAIITNLLNIGRIYLETGEFGKATEFLQRALEESKEIDTKPKICSANQLLADLFEKKGDFKNALSYYKSSYAYKEQVFSEESKFKLLNLQTVHKIETAQKEAEIYHLKNIQLSVENDRKSEELERARTLQVSMLPKNDIASSHIEMIGKMRTATEVGGDYYDFIDLSGNNYAAVIGDATGHGVAAGLVVGMIKMALISALQTDTRILPIDRLMENLNIALKKSIPTPGMGMSLGLAIIDSEKKAADLCFAGMPFPFHYHYESRELTAFEMRCPSLGFFNRLPVKTRSVQLKANDLLIFLSDGFEERMNSRYETWSRGKLAQELHHICRRESNVKKIAEALFEACDEFACDYENQDDMTIVVIKFT